MKNKKSFSVWCHSHHRLLMFSLVFTMGGAIVPYVNADMRLESKYSANYRY